MIVSLGDTITTPRQGRNPRVCRTVVWVGADEFRYRVWLPKKRKYVYATLRRSEAQLRFGDFIQRFGVQRKKLLVEAEEAEEA